MEELIAAKKYNEAEILLEELGIASLEKINKFEHSLNESEFKRFNVEMIEDWSDIKEEILEELSDVKSFEFSKVGEGRSEYLQDLEKIVETINARIEILRSEFENSKESKNYLQESLRNEDTQYTEQFLEGISALREKVYNLEYDLGQIWLNNLEFKDFLKDITISWINVKIEIQQFLAGVIQEFNMMRVAGSEEAANTGGLKQKITFEFLNQQFQNAVMQADSKST